MYAIHDCALGISPVTSFSGVRKLHMSGKRSGGPHAKTATTCNTPPMSPSRVLMMSLVSTRVFAMLRRCLHHMHAVRTHSVRRSAKPAGQMPAYNHPGGGLHSIRTITEQNIRRRQSRQGDSRPHLLTPEKVSSRPHQCSTAIYPDT